MFKGQLVVLMLLLSSVFIGCSDNSNAGSSSNNNGVDTTAPEFVSSSSINVDENQIDALTLHATDQTSITYAILDSNDSSSFSVNNTSGKVTFISAPDFETKALYTFTVSATDTAGNIATQVITITINDIDENIPAPIVQDGVTYGVVVSPYTGKQWLDRNLGASQVCTALDDVSCYGGYYQWGRQSDGHQDFNSQTTAIKATDVTTVGHDMFITTNSGDWADNVTDLSIRTENWGKADGSSVCPTGYRVPTMAELKAETVLSVGDVNNITDAFNNFLKLPSSGRRDNDASYLGQDGSIFIWTRDHLALFIGSSWQPHSGDLSEGLSVRCIQNMLPVAFDQAITVVEQNSTNNSITLQADDEDKELVSYTVVSQPLHGSLSGVAPNLTYTPDIGYDGNDSFTFKVNDGAEDSNIATVDISISSMLSTGIIMHRGLEYKEVISPYTTKVWLDRNLGASQVCTALNNEACYGDYYQWGRDSDGHEKSSSTSIAEQAVRIDNAGVDLRDASNTDNSDWANVIDFDGTLRSAQWSNTSGTSVCPSGFRVPTMTELKNETVDSMDAMSNNTEAFNSFLKLPSSGWRYASGGLVQELGTVGSVWSSSPTTTSYTYQSFMLTFGTTFVETSDRHRERGASVRCIKNY